MALDYSKLSTDELEAIANDDFTKLSNKTLRALSNEPEPTALDKFKEPFKDVSIKDWREKSLLAPALQVMQAVSPFGMLRPDLARQNLQEGSQNLTGKIGQMAQGAYNVATNPVESAQKAYTAVTENPAGVAGELAKGILYDPEMLIGSGLGNLAEKGIKSTVSGVGAAAAMPINLGRGAFRGMAYPGGTAPNTALVPIKPNYVPHEQVRQFMAGERPATSLTTASTSELINQTAGGRWAYGMAPKNAAGERLVPAQGRLMEGIGENIGAGIRTNPIQGLLDIAGLATVYTPVGSMIKAVPAAATTRLSQATNFEPGFVAARNAALAREGRAGLQGSLPQTPLLSGPVRPGGEYTPTVYVGPTGEATTNVAGTQTNYRPAPTRSSTFNEVRGGGFGQASQTPAELARAAAAARITPPKTPEQQAILDSIRARAQASGAKYTPPRADTPTVGPVAPTDIPPAPATTTAPRPTDLQSRLAALQNNPQANAVLGEPTYTPKEVKQFETQQKTARKGYGAGETVSEIEVLSAENKAAKSGAANDQRVAEQMRARLDYQTANGITHITKQQAAEGATLAQQRRGPPVNVAPVSGPVAPVATPEPIAQTPPSAVQSTVPTKTTSLLKATEGRAAVQAALASGEPSIIKYKTSSGTVTEYVNKTSKVKFDSDLEMNHTIVRPDSTTLFGTKKSSGIPVKIEMMDLSTQSANPEFIKVFDNSKPKSPVLMSTYDKDGTLTSTPSSSKKAPPGVIEMIVPDKPIVHANKAAFDKANLFDTLAGKTPAGSYREGNKIITVSKQSLGPFGENTITRAVDVKTGEPVPVGAKWDANAGDPQPFGSKVRDKLNKNK